MTSHVTNLTAFYGNGTRQKLAVVRSKLQQILGDAKANPEDIEWEASMLRKQIDQLVGELDSPPPQAA